MRPGPGSAPSARIRRLTRRDLLQSRLVISSQASGASGDSCDARGKAAASGRAGLAVIHAARPLDLPQAGWGTAGKDIAPFAGPGSERGCAGLARVAVRHTQKEKIATGSAKQIV